MAAVTTETLLLTAYICVLVFHFPSMRQGTYRVSKSHRAESNLLIERRSIRTTKRNSGELLKCHDGKRNTNTTSVRGIEQCRLRLLFIRGFWIFEHADLELTETFVDQSLRSDSM